MNLVEMNRRLGALLDREVEPYDPPSDADWRELETKFGCTFGPEFRDFICLMATYCFPGDIFNVSTGRTNGNDAIHLVYDFEVNDNSRWDRNMIPFYGIGNGDYFCLNMTECPSSKVYYYFHDREVPEVYSNSFKDWIEALPAFLGVKSPTP